ncbi:TraG family conjugative transposon ATPase [Chitinophaga silvisoli]|uniref:TraG family conjugative transposon ATPase n=1 Tax=Chitinophaga silvisoli TaxID=2291814 RepID=A0A3E1P2N6_9BACT|nr:TraG family conjugative transposon ATPase [Chitinophaga silvisoli]RFM34432.1 TraG family conjugative transposon ATPase [Chitinophaga silvisoli]
MIVVLALVLVVVTTVVLQIKPPTDTSKKLESIIPIYKVENDAVVSKNGDITIAFQLHLPEIFTLSPEELDAIHHAWVKAMRILPIGTILHKQDWYVDMAYKGNFNKEDHTFLSYASEKYFHERPYLDHSCYLMLTLPAKGRRPASSVLSNLLRNSFVPPQALNPAIYQHFLDKAGQFEKLITASGVIRSSKLSTADYIGDERKAGVLERYLFLAPGGKAPEIKDITFKPDLRIGENHCQLYTLGDVENLPSVCSPKIQNEKYSTDKTKFFVGFASPVGQLLSCNHIYNQYVVIQDPLKETKQLEAKRRRMQSLSNYSRENSISRDAANDFLNEAISEQRQFVRAHFNILAWSDDAGEVKDLRNKVATSLTQMNVVPSLEIKGAPQLFWAGMPGNAADLPMNETFSTFSEQAICFFNQESSAETSIAPVGIRLADRITGKPLFVDLDLAPRANGVIQNLNRVILGPSGSGKSFFTNAYMRSCYEQGAHVVIIDVGHSYSGLCSLVNGYYFTYEEKNPIRFNPFYISVGDTLDTEKKESIKTLLLALWKKDTEIFKRSEYVALSNALTAYYVYLDANATVFPCFNTFYEFFRDDYAAILEAEKVHQRDFDINNFLFVMKPYYVGGEFDYLLNATENLNLLEQRFIVFELDNIKDNQVLFTAATITVMQLYINKMRKLKGIRKVILIEEAWKALMKEGFAEYIKYLYKTVRKFYGEAIVVSQEADDMIASPIVKQAIINNSDTKILLDQSKYQNKFDQIQELLGLSDKEKALILSMNKANEQGRKYKEVFISLGGTVSKVYRTEVSPQEYYTYTTEQTEKTKVQQLAAIHGSMEKGIQAIVRAA